MVGGRLARRAQWRAAQRRAVIPRPFSRPAVLDLLNHDPRAPSAGAVLGEREPGGETVVLATTMTAPTGSGYDAGAPIWCGYHRTAPLMCGASMLALYGFVPPSQSVLPPNGPADSHYSTGEHACHAGGGIRASGCELLMTVPAMTRLCR